MKLYPLFVLMKYVYCAECGNVISIAYFSVGSRLDLIINLYRVVSRSSRYYFRVFRLLQRNVVMNAMQISSGSNNVATFLIQSLLMYSYLSIVCHINSALVYCC